MCKGWWDNDWSALESRGREAERPTGRGAEGRESARAPRGAAALDARRRRTLAAAASYGNLQLGR